jgi:alpha-ketoglutarate-dependent taurine dioxygenase
MGTQQSEGMAWRSRDFAGPAAGFSLELDRRERDEILAALAALERASRLAPAQALTQADFPCGALADRLREALEEVRRGRGFVVLRGLPVDSLDLDRFIAVVWGVGLHFGHALSQSAQGELIGHVVDATREDATPRMFRSSLELRPHTDVTAMIALACWNRSHAGGNSVVTSAVTVHDEIKKRRPDLLEPLYRGFHYHRLGEEGPGEEPVTPYRMPVFAVREGRVSCRYQRAGIAAGQRELGVPLTQTELEALDLFDAIAKAPENRLAFNLERGDMLVINNYTVMHARTRFIEHPEPERRRHLVRLWLDTDGFRDVPAEFRLFPSANGVPPQPGRSCSYDFKKLYNQDPAASGGVPDLELSEAEVVKGS